MADCREGEFGVTVSVAGGDPFHTVSFPLTAAEATPGVLISTLEDGYIDDLGDGTRTRGRKWYVPNHSDNSRSESRRLGEPRTLQRTGARLAWPLSSKRRTAHQPWLAATG
jgi:hypothetical protein